MNRKTFAALLGIAVIAIFGTALLLQQSKSNKKTGTDVLHVVAGENVWGSLLAQLGGSHVKLTTVVSSPDADPHEFESTTTTARAFANADYVVLNGAGYDNWGDKLLGANTSPNRKVLDIADLVGKNNGDNPHFWYSPAYAQKAIQRMSNDLIALDPAHRTDYQHNLTQVENGFMAYREHIAGIKLPYPHAKVAATEDIFVYLAQAADLDLVSPPDFMEAVAEGNDPPAASVTRFHQQLEKHEATVLVYNKQTVTPLTESIKKLAEQQRIPVVGITETIQPPNASFQDWMNTEVTNLEHALAQGNALH